MHHVGLPTMAGYGGTDAVATDSWQSTMEELHPLTFAPLDRAETFTAIGLSKTYTLFSPEKMILDDELYHRVRYGVLDIPVDDDELALDVVDDVGPGGHYLAHRHTRGHMRGGDGARPGARAGGRRARYRDPLEVARERGIDILQRYRPEPLADDKARELRRDPRRRRSRVAQLTRRRPGGRATPGPVDGARVRRDGGQSSRRRSTASASPATSWNLATRSATVSVSF